MFKVAIIANNKDSEQTVSFRAVWSGFIVFAPMMKSSLKCIIAADVKCRHHFRDRINTGKLRVNYTFLVTKGEDNLIILYFYSIRCQQQDIHILM